jgi:hypothetical protein
LTKNQKPNFFILIIVVVAMGKEKRPGCLFFFQIATSTKNQNKEIWYLAF